MRYRLAAQLERGFWGPQESSKYGSLVEDNQPTYLYAEVDRLVGLRPVTSRRWINGYERGGRYCAPILRTRAETTEWVRFVVDENLLRLGRAISQLKRHRAPVGQAPVADVLPTGIQRLDWIPILGQRGWVMITNDQRIRTEAILAVENSLKVIHLHGRVGNEPAWQQAIRLFSRWEAIDDQLGEKPDGPWWLSVSRQRVQTMRFEPGAVERA